MTLAILIIAYLLWFGDCSNIFREGKSNVFFSGALVTLLSWQVSTPWGITMLVVCSIVCVAAVIKAHVSSV